MNKKYPKDIDKKFWGIMEKYTIGYIAVISIIFALGCAFLITLSREMDTEIYYNKIGVLWKNI